MRHMRTEELTKFLRNEVEPLHDSIHGSRYRAAARLSDGTYLPCVVFESRQAQLELALRRFEQLRWKRSEYKAVVETFAAGGSRVPEYYVMAVELSPFAWPLELLRTIHGETTMGWTAFVAEMNDGTMHSYGTQFHFEFFDLSAGYSPADIRQIHSGKVYSVEKGLEAFSADSYKGTVDSYRHSPCLREKPFFTCYINMNGLET
jgi:hypothetical protein